MECLQGYDFGYDYDLYDVCDSCEEETKDKCREVNEEVSDDGAGWEW